MRSIDLGDIKVVVQEVQKLLGIDLVDYLSSVESFFTSTYPKLTNFFTNGIGTLSLPYIEELLQLLNWSCDINDRLRVVQLKSENTLYWDILLLLGTIHQKLLFTTKLNKWTRSSISNLYTYSPTTNTKYLIPDSSSLGDVSRYFDKLVSPRDIGVLNRLTEDSYSNYKQPQLNIPLPKSQQRGLNPNSIVSVINTPEDLLGRDIDRLLSWDGDGDLVVLDPQTTILQSVAILLSLRVGDSPLYTQSGIQSELIGASKAGFNFPIILRQIFETFRSDDSILSIELVNFSYSNNLSYSVEFTINTLYGSFTTSQSI